MIPRLFIPGTKDFSNEGLGRLAECTSFTVTEERNGIYEAEFGYPIEGRLFSQIREGYIVYATHDDTKDPQPFEIYSHQAPLEGIVTYRARHISYQLNNVICRPYQAADCAAALAGIRSAALTGCDFSFSTDKAVSADFKTSVPQSARSILGGTQGSILDVYGKGDYEFNGFTVKLWVNRGSDRGVSIRYGKNLVSLDQQFDGSNQYNAFVPYWQSSDGAVVYLDHAVMGNTQITTAGPLQVRSFEAIQTHVPADILVRYGSIKTVALDLSGDFEEQPTLAELEARAQALISNSDAYEVRENLSIDFVQLWQTEEYKTVANLQRILLCDTVHIYYEKLGINATAKCIKVIYDTLNERYLSMELGQPTTTLSEQVVSLVGTETKSQIQEAKSTMAEAIKNATELITGGFGGYIKYNYLDDGTPSEMLIMDSPEESTATNIIRLNQNGLGFSTDGGVTYGNAWTIDGKLNADYITTGTLDAARIAANSIAVGKLTGSIANGSWGINFDTGTMSIGTLAVGSITGNISNGNWRIDFDQGTFTIGTISADNIFAGTISDAANKNSWNLTTGQLVTTQGTLGGWTIDSSGLTSTTTVSGVTSSASIYPSGADYYERQDYYGSKVALNPGELAFFSWDDDNSTWAPIMNIVPNLDTGLAYGSITINDYHQPVMILYEEAVDILGDITVDGSGGNVLLIH